MMSGVDVLNRHDTFLGICEAIGQDFGFHPDWLRALLSLALLFGPGLVIALYLALGLLVAASRWLFPPRAVEAVHASPRLCAALSSNDDDRRLDLPIAA